MESDFGVAKVEWSALLHSWTPLQRIHDFMSEATSKLCILWCGVLELSFGVEYWIGVKFWSGLLFAHKIVYSMEWRLGVE